MASKDLKEKEEIKDTKKTKKEKNKKVKETKNIKKHETVVIVDNEEEAKKVLMEVLDAPVNATEKEMKSHFLSEAKALLMILLIIGAFIGSGFLIYKYVKPFESKKPQKEETKVTETNDYKTVFYKALEGHELTVINDKYLIETKDKTLYKLFDMDGNILFEGTESYTQILSGIDDELYLTHVGADQKNDNASISIYKFNNKELEEVFTADDENYLFTTLIYTNNNNDYLLGVVGETLHNEENVKVETLLYTLNGEKQELKDVRLHGENPFRLAIDEPIVTYNKDYIVVKDTNNEYKYGIYDINNKDIILNTKYDGLYTTNTGNYIAVKGKKAGIVNVKSKILVDFKYDFIYDAGTFYVVSKDKKLGILDNEFKVVIKPTFTFQQVENSGFSYQPCCGAINSFNAYKYKDKYVLTVNEKELSYDLKYKVHETYIIDSKGEYLTIGANEFNIYKDFIYGYDKDARKYSIYDENFAEKYTIDISKYDFEDGPYISLINDNTIVVSLDTELYYDYLTGEEIESIKDATFTVDKIEFKYINKDKKVYLKVNGDVLGEYKFNPQQNEDIFYYNIADKIYYYVTNDTYVMVRKSE